MNCTKELDDACQFREKVVHSLEYWSNNFHINHKIKQLERNEDKSVYNEICLSPISEELIKEQDIPEDTDDNITTFSCDECNFQDNKLEKNEQKTDYGEICLDTISDNFINEELLKTESVDEKLLKTESIDEELHKTDSVDEELLKTEALDVKATTFMCDKYDLKSGQLETLKQELGYSDICQDAININVMQGEIFETEDSEEKTTKFSCDKCTQIFTTASELLHHNCTNKNNLKENKTTTNNNGKENLVFLCEICDKSFKKNWQLNRHKKVFHLNVKNYICSYCNRGFKQLYHLREHITSHTGERKFKCDICNKTFSRMSSQRKHMKAHEAAPGEKSKKSPFLCSICGKKFPYSNGAQRHMRTHSDDRRFECKICGNKFSQTTHLRVHLRTHTGEKPYPCKLCTESFSLNANLRKHMKNHKKPENVKIFHNLEPNLSETIGEFDVEDSQNRLGSDFIERELPFSFVEGGF